MIKQRLKEILKGFGIVHVIETQVVTVPTAEEKTELILGMFKDPHFEREFIRELRGRFEVPNLDGEDEIRMCKTVFNVIFKRMVKQVIERKRDEED